MLRNLYFKKNVNLEMDARMLKKALKNKIIVLFTSNDK